MVHPAHPVVEPGEIDHRARSFDFLWPARQRVSQRLLELDQSSLLLEPLALAFATTPMPARPNPLWLLLALQAGRCQARRPRASPAAGRRRGWCAVSLPQP